MDKLGISLVVLTVGLIAMAGALVVVVNQYNDLYHEYDAYKTIAKYYGDKINELTLENGELKLMVNNTSNP